MSERRQSGDLPMYYSRLLEVIETTRMAGRGTNDDPYRLRYEYWSRGGELLATKDEWNAAKGIEL